MMNDDCDGGWQRECCMFARCWMRDMCMGVRVHVCDCEAGTFDIVLCRGLLAQCLHVI
jgi:hypothetical protein